MDEVPYRIPPVCDALLPGLAAGFGSGCSKDKGQKHAASPVIQTASLHPSQHAVPSPVTNQEAAHRITSQRPWLAGVSTHCKFNVAFCSFWYKLLL